MHIPEYSSEYSQGHVPETAAPAPPVEPIAAGQICRPAVSPAAETALTPLPPVEIARAAGSVTTRAMESPNLESANAANEFNNVGEWTLSYHDGFTDTIVGTDGGASKRVVLETNADSQARYVVEQKPDGRFVVDSVESSRDSLPPEHMHTEIDDQGVIRTSGSRTGGKEIVLNSIGVDALGEILTDTHPAQVSAEEILTVAPDDPFESPPAANETAEYAESRRASSDLDKLADQYWGQKNRRFDEEGAAVYAGLHYRTPAGETTASVSYALNRVRPIGDVIMDMPHGNFVLTVTEAKTATEVRSTAPGAPPAAQPEHSDNRLASDPLLAELPGDTPLTAQREVELQVVNGHLWKNVVYTVSDTSGETIWQEHTTERAGQGDVRRVRNFLANPTLRRRH